MQTDVVVPASEKTHRLPPAAPAFAGATVLAFTLFLCACGKREDLKPIAGRALPQKAASSPRQATVSDLLARPPQSQPERVDDLLRKSQERREDRFDLPPAG